MWCSIVEAKTTHKDFPSTRWIFYLICNTYESPDQRSMTLLVHQLAANYILSICWLIEPMPNPATTQAPCRCLRRRCWPTGLFIPHDHGQARQMKYTVMSSLSRFPWSLADNVVHKRVATTSEWPPPNTIVNAVYSTFTSQQPWSVGTSPYSLILSTWYLVSLGSLKKFYDFMIPIYIFLVFLRRIFRYFSKS